MASFNRVILLGNCTREIELKYTQSNTAIAEVGLAVNEKVKRGGEWCDDVVFVDVTCFGRTAEVAADFLRKGSPVFFEGRLSLSQWEKDGKKFSKLKVIAERLQLLGSKGRRDDHQDDEPEYPKHNADPASNRAARQADADKGDESIPF